MNNYQTVVKRGLDDEECDESESLIIRQTEDASKLGRIEVNEKAPSNYNS